MRNQENDKRTFKNEARRTRWIWIVGLSSLAFMIITGQFRELFLFAVTFGKVTV